MPTVTQTLCSLWWITIPKRAASAPGWAAGILRDGAYLRAWPELAAWAPVGAVVLGLASGFWHFGSGLTYTFSIPLMALMLLASSAGAAIGFWLCLSFSISDFLLYGHFAGQSDFGNVIGITFSLLLSYVLLGLLLVRSVFLTNTIAQRVLRGKLSFRNSIVMRAVVQGLIQGGLAWVWVHAVPSLIRPVFTWSGGPPPDAAMQPLQQDGWILVAIGLAGGAGRAVVERWGSAKAGKIGIGLGETALLRAPARPSLPAAARIGLQCCYVTFVLSGLLASWLDAIFLAAALFLIRLGAPRLSGKLVRWDALLLRVPFLIRMLAGLVASYFLANWIVTALWSQTNTFRPVLISVVLSLAVVILLAPESRRGGATVAHAQGGMQ